MRKLLPPLNPVLLWHTSAKFRYLATGAWNTIAGYAIFAGFYLLAGQWIGYLAVAAISHILAVTQSFATQRRLVFRSRGNRWAEYLRFHVAHLGSLLLGLALLPTLVELLRMPPLLAQGLITVLVVVISYYVHQRFTFRSPADEN